jgi:predicted nucleic acid-binding protein
VTDPARVFVDANVFLRFFTADDEGQAARAEHVFRRAAAGDLALVTGPPVLFELVWTLRSAYKQSKIQVLTALKAVLALRGLELSDRALVEEAVRLASASGQEFADAYIAASVAAAGGGALATFNRRHFDRLGTPLYHL